MRSSGPYHEKTARQRLAAVVDEGSFIEVLPPPERETSPYLEKLGQPVAFDDGVVIGRATIAGHETYIAAQEGKFVGGAVGEVHAAKLTGLVRSAARDRLSCVLLVESGGVRLHEGSSGEIGISEVMRAVFDCRAVGVPTIAVIGSDIGAYGGMGILATCCDHLIMTEHGRLGVSGPIVIEKWMGVDAYDSSDRALVWMTSGGKTKYVMGDADVLANNDATSVRKAIVPLLSQRRSVDLDAVKARHAELSTRIDEFGTETDPAAIWRARGVADVAAGNLASAEEFAPLVHVRSMG